MSKDLNNICVILINSKSVRVIEAKLLVYRKYKEIIKSRNILLHHAFENLDEIRVKIIVHKLSSLKDTIVLLSDFTLNCLELILKDVTNEALSMVNIVADVSGGSIETKNHLVEKSVEKFSSFFRSKFYSKIKKHQEFRNPENIDCGCFFQKFYLSKEKVNAIPQVVTSSLINILRKRIHSMDIKFEKQKCQFPQRLHAFVLKSKESFQQEMWSSIENDMESTKNELHEIYSQIVELQKYKFELPDQKKGNDIHQSVLFMCLYVVHLLLTFYF